MNFLIFVATFVTLACVVLPVAVLAVFAVIRDAQTRGSARQVTPGQTGASAIDEWRSMTGGSGAAASAERSAPSNPRSPLVDRKPSVPSGHSQTVVT